MLRMRSARRSSSSRQGAVEAEAEAKAAPAKLATTPAIVHRGNSIALEDEIAWLAELPKMGRSKRFPTPGASFLVIHVLRSTRLPDGEDGGVCPHRYPHSLIESGRAIYQIPRVSAYPAWHPVLSGKTRNANGIMIKPAL